MGHLVLSITLAECAARLISSAIYEISPKGEGAQLPDQAGPAILGAGPTPLVHVLLVHLLTCWVLLSKHYVYWHGYYGSMAGSVGMYFCGPK